MAEAVTDNLEYKMAEATPGSAPLFIDVASSVEQYPISVVLPDVQTNTEAVVANIKVEPDCKTERSTSPLAPYLDIQTRRLRCTECSKFTAETEEKMLRHIRKVHRGENPFQCYMCDYTTYNKSLFEEHVRIHQGIKPFKCSHCPYRSVSKKNTKKHELIHRPDNPHRCAQCGFIARHIKSLQCHINTEHPNQNWEEIVQVKQGKQGKCNICKRVFEDLEAHEKNRQKCEQCQKICCNKGLLKKHLSSAHGAKNRISRADFVCAICKWTSNIKPRILLHLIHHPNQPVDSKIVDVRVLKECGIVGQGW